MIEFLFEICPPFFFLFLFLKEHFQMFLGLLNMQCASFQSKTSTLYFGRKSQLVVSRGIFIRNLIDFFFFFTKKHFLVELKLQRPESFTVTLLILFYFWLKWPKHFGSVSKLERITPYSTSRQILDCFSLFQWF